MVSLKEFEQAVERGRAAQAQSPLAVKARYDRRTRRVVVRLDTGADFAFPPSQAQGLETGSPEELGDIEITPSGLGLHWPRLDADLYLPALLQGVFGSKAWTAARMGAEGGKSRSPAKTEAARANGRLGGRPRKVA